MGNGRRWSANVHKSALVCRCEGRYPGIQTATQSFVGNDALRRRSATAETSMFIVPVLPSTAVT